MNKQQHHLAYDAQSKRTIPVPRIVKPAQPASSGTHAVPPKLDPTHPLRPAHVLKTGYTPKHTPWLTTARIPRISKIP